MKRECQSSLALTGLGLSGDNLRKGVFINMLDLNALYNMDCMDGMMQGKSISEGHIMQGNKSLNEIRIHPTQKPVALYEWLLSRYAKEGDIIIDTHVGSASSLIACHNLDHRYIGFEIDKHYYDLATKRMEEHFAQLRLI